MSKLIVVGDLHGHNGWKNILLKDYDFDKIIFLGDYIDSFTISTDDQYNNLLDLLQYKKDFPDKVILLRGNHKIRIY